MSTETVIKKGRDGWAAESKVPMDAGRTLRVSTYKGSRGGLSTFATSVIETDCGFSFIVFTDYNKEIADDRSVRCTEKTVHAQHASVMARIGHIVAQANAHQAAIKSKAAA